MLEAPTIIAGLDDVAMVGEPVEQGGGHLGIAEHARPLAERQVGGDDHLGALAQSSDIPLSRSGPGYGYVIWQQPS